jgi:catechol 2,3-dioxygenase-like lactoylglutathione lyase family enzyme
LQETIAFYVNHFGLDLANRQPDEVSLKGTGHQLRQVKFVAGKRARLRGLTFEVDPSADLQDFRRVLIDRGVRTENVSEGTLRIKDPDGTNVELTWDSSWEAEDARQPGNRPIFLSHVVINTPEAARLVTFYVQALGFRVSDKYEKGLLTFLRCDQPQHHCIGISPASYSGLNHFAMDCGTVDAVMTGVGRMKRAGFEPIWGPGRHRPGGNIFCYFEDPNGFVAEFTSNLISIPDGDEWVPKEWPRTPENGNVWGTGGPTPRAIKLMNENPPE